MLYARKRATTKNRRIKKIKRQLMLNVILFRLYSRHSVYSFLRVRNLSDVYVDAIAPRRTYQNGSEECNEVQTHANWKLYQLQHQRTQWVCSILTALRR